MEDNNEHWLDSSLIDWLIHGATTLLLILVLTFIVSLCAGSGCGVGCKLHIDSQESSDAP